MKAIEIDQLAFVCGGTSAHDYCVAHVETKARSLSRHGKLRLDGARKLISSVQSNGLYGCEREGLRNVRDKLTTTGPAYGQLDWFLRKVDGPGVP